MTTDTDAFDLSPPTGGSGAPSFTFGDLSSPPDGFEQPLPTIISPPSFKEWPGSARDDAPLAKPAILNLDPGSPMDDGVARPPGDFPQGRLTDPLQHDGPTPYFAAPIDRQFHYYGALIDHADAYKAANGRDPEGADLAAIQDRAAAEAFPPGEEPVALRPYAAPASAVTSTSAPVGDGPAMSDTGEGGPVPQEQPASTPETEPPTSDTPEPAAPPPAEEPKPEPPKEEPPAAPEPGQQIAEAPSNQGDAGPPEGKKAEADKAPTYHVSPKTKEEILDEAHKNGGHLWPPDVKEENRRQCVSLPRAVTPDLPRASEWESGPRVTYGDPSVKPGTALATFGPDGKYGSDGPHHAVVFEGWETEGGRNGMKVVEQADGMNAREKFIPFGVPSNRAIYQAERYSPIRKSSVK